MSGDAARHRRTYLFFCSLLPAFLKLKFNFFCEPAPPTEGAYLVLCNHNTDYDPLLTAMSFRDRHMYFVASEHVYRAGLWSFLLKRYFAPISRMKGGTDASTAMSILRTLRRGHNVCLYAEGNRSWNGETGPIHPSTAKLVRAAGVMLLTYRLEGGYLTSPRWSASLRRGRMRGGVVGVYTPAQLKAMDDGALAALIARDLYENAWERQAQDPVAFKGRDLAENIETALYVCPVCGGLDTLRSRGDSFWCTACGTRAVYTPAGALDGGFPIKDLLAWDRFQTAALRERAAALTSDEALFSDGGFVLSVLSEHRAQRVDAGVLSMSKQTLRCGATQIPLADVAEMSMFGRLTLVFSANGAHYELRPAQTCCARKYLEFYKIIKE